MRRPAQCIRYGKAMLRVTLLVLAAVKLSGCALPDAPEASGATTIYVLRHAEPNFADPDRPLDQKGRARSESLVAHFSGVPITHIYATHTDRTRDTLMPLAKQRGLAVEQFPTVGTKVDGAVVTNRTTGKTAIKPLVAALKALPAGSTAVVAANSGNLYPILAGVGARIDSACTADRTDCLQCSTSKCFDEKRFDYVWKVVSRRDGQVTLSRAAYGD